MEHTSMVVSAEPDEPEPKQKVLGDRTLYTKSSVTGIPLLFQRAKASYLERAARPVAVVFKLFETMKDQDRIVLSLVNTHPYGSL